MSDTILLPKTIKDTEPTRKSETSTLLVAASWHRFLIKKSDYYFAAYLNLLLRKYKKYLLSGNLPENPPNPTTRYQETGLNLIRINFRPDADDWCELGLLATSLGISRCRLFRWLLWLESIGFYEKHLSLAEYGGVPTTPAEISLTQTFNRTMGILTNYLQTNPDKIRVRNVFRDMERKLAIELDWP